jgi:hypothetical protein
VVLILDTNILVSALIVPGGPPDFLYQNWRAGRFSLVTCREQLDEFRRVTRYPRLQRFLQPGAAGTMLNEIRALAEMAGPCPKSASVPTQPTISCSPWPRRAEPIIWSRAMAGTC